MVLICRLREEIRKASRRKRGCNLGSICCGAPTAVTNGHEAGESREDASGPVRETSVVVPLAGTTDALVAGEKMTDTPLAPSWRIVMKSHLRMHEARFAHPPRRTPREDTERTEGSWSSGRSTRSLSRQR
jgi:hypothetical protein